MTTPLHDRLLAAWHAAFDADALPDPGPSLVVRAPGRVNLIGEHTDYNDGFVLPCAIDYQTLVAIRPRGDARVRVVASDFGDAQDQFELGAALPHHPDLAWANYVRGVLHTLWGRGLPLRGADIAIAGDVPQGAGLSSSASLEVALIEAFNRSQPLGLDPSTVALIAQQAENEFVGCQCGIMDQLISARGRAGHALLIDCRTLDARPVPLPADLAVMIIHSRVARGLVESAYNERRAQCTAAAAHFGVPALRDLDESALASDGDAPGGMGDRAAALDPVVRRRARHVLSENRRTLEAADALAAGDLVRLGRLMAESHASMRDDFQITVPAVDELVAIAQAAIGPQGGARMTGGGFGGCVVALMPRAQAPAVQAAVLAQYRSPEGLPPLVWVCRATDGAGALSAA